MPVLIAVLAILGRSWLQKFVRRAAQIKSVNEKRLFYISRSIDALFLTGCFVLLLGYTGLNVGDLGVFLGSFIAVLGVTLFAQWSILSNATASVLIFFFFPYRVGDHVTILDGDNTVSGTIKEIALFHIILAGNAGKTIAFPTSLIFQKAVTVEAGPVIGTENGNEKD
jgi:small-conductance mechanosensitive channel